MPNICVLGVWGFLGVALCLYLVLGGADYGAGILEVWPAGRFRLRQKSIINHALGPVWEANHMWLIIVVVILFIGFPRVFNIVMIALHLPMVALLFGVVLRGAVFTFRHYDAVQSQRSQNAYTALFAVSSLWTSLWIGVIAAGLFRGRIDPLARDPWDAYVAPWWGLFPLSVGGLVCVLFAFLAAVYLVGETRENDLRRFFVRRAMMLNALVYIASGFVFWAGAHEKNAFLMRFWSNAGARLFIGVAVVCLGSMWWLLRRGMPMPMRIAAAGHNTAIVLGWYVLHAPNALILTSGPLSFFEAAAGDATLLQLLVALSAGSLFIFPSLFALLVTFKRKEAPAAP